MFKALLLFLTVSICTNLLGQNLPIPLAGRWRTHFDAAHTDDILFTSNGNGAIVTPNGRLLAHFNFEVKGYVIKDKNKAFVVLFSFDVERSKNPRFQSLLITFNNDSTFLCHATGVSPFSSYFTKTDRLYTRVDTTARENDMQPSTQNDLKGRWLGHHLNNDEYDTDKKRDMKLYFVDDDHMVVTHGDSVHVATYSINLKRQPSPIEITYTETGRTIQALLMFIGTDKMRIQFFPNNNRGDHFTEIGNTMWLLRESLNNKN